MKVPHRGARRARSRAGSRGVTIAGKEKLAPRKRAGGEFPRGTCEGAAEIIVRVRVLSRKPRTAAAQDGGDLWSRRSALEQLLGDPFIGDAPVGLGEAFQNPQAVQPSGIEVGRTSGCCGTGRPVRASGIGVRGSRQRNVWRHRQAGVTAQTALGLLQQRRRLGSQAGVSVQHLYPGRVTASVASLWFLIGEAGQAAQMTPIGAGGVAAVEVSQLFADLAGNSRWDGCGTDSHPGLKIVGTGLEYHTGFVTGGPHGFHNGWVGAIQIDKNITGIALLCVGMKVHVTAFPVANAQEPDGGRMGQLGSGPQPLSRECSASRAMDETDEVKVVRHGRELAAHGQQREIESSVDHGPNFGIERARRTMDSQRTANSGLTGCLSLGVHFSNGV